MTPEEQTTTFTIPHSHLFRRCPEERMHARKRKRTDGQGQQQQGLYCKGGKEGDCNVDGGAGEGVGWGCVVI